MVPIIQLQKIDTLKRDIQMICHEHVKYLLYRRSNVDSVEYDSIFWVRERIIGRMRLLIFCIDYGNDI